MSSRGWAAFAAMSVLFGIPYLFVKVAVDGGVPPALVAWGRVALAAVVLLALAGRAGTLRSLRGRWRWLAAYTVVEIAVPFPMIAFGEQHVSSSLAAIVIASLGVWSYFSLREAARRAEERSKLAREVVDDMYTRVADEWLSDEPHRDALQLDFLQKAANLYEEFAHESGDDPARAAPAA